MLIILQKPLNSRIKLAFRISNARSLLELKTKFTYNGRRIQSLANLQTPPLRNN